MIGKIYITEQMALSGFYCPQCGQLHVANGTGPASSPILSKLLSKLPTDSVLRYGAFFHDAAYTLGPYFGTREEADLLYYTKNEEQIVKKCHWYSRWWYRRRNLQNYQAVREFGAGSYNAKGCDGRYNA